jgi:2,4-dienoyl-CoA reductase-like NADH-dependent reductase (Old Yellow Enzyme family)
VRNRIVIAPMCQYSADEGCATDWHLSRAIAAEKSGTVLLNGVDIIEFDGTREEAERFPDAANFAHKIRQLIHLRRLCSIGMRYCHD